MSNYSIMTEPPETLAERIFYKNEQRFINKATEFLLERFERDYEDTDFVESDEFCEWVTDLAWDMAIYYTCHEEWYDGDYGQSDFEEWAKREKLPNNIGA